nr:MAG TPA: transposase DDE domain protein [Inoviridae sp.]
MIIDAFVEEMDLESLGFEGANPSTTGHPSYRPAVLLKIYIYGYLNRVQSSRRLERSSFRSMSTNGTSRPRCIRIRPRSRSRSCSWCSWCWPLRPCLCTR